MSKQETFFTQQSGTRIVAVIKIYDERRAAESFHQMDKAALKFLWDAIEPEALYGSEGLPSLGDPSGEAEAFLWDELRVKARQESPETSFFIVTARDGSTTKALYVSPDWWSAIKFSQQSVGVSI